ncbi:histidine phosphatase family protein [Thioalkalivibrio sulfidiphilus]|uniref:Putative phosphohistidine phosphatase, SixA n=1 Tax=Thioalkalivibrio sulfidiphilus (strain HL-EbGR7) TaxID=396588 RepID=B8GLK1_THISH|nr:histidine phosphatase family protein [Thioalkalivibrio sulfidiphilus]ACL73556.1 putative phosphohistidine phosphatase, SixA [Thioalkalivibrio sulfidiphilus HL-EbGr7]
MKHLRRRLLLAGALLPWLLGTVHAGTDDPHRALLEQLRAGGLVIYWRHAITDRSRRDQDLSDMARCERQRNLSEAGREQARTMGEDIHTLGIPVGEVISSPFCRNVETARLGFGRHSLDEGLYNWPPASAERKPQLVAALQEMLATPPIDSASNTVLVGHNLNLQQAARVHIEEGDLAVFQPLGAEGFRHLGNLTDGDLRRLRLDERGR